MDNKKRNVQVESDGSRSALVPLWRELPQITVPERRKHHLPLYCQF